MSLSNRIAVYTGVFDPVHRGHLDVIERGSRIFDHLVVGVGNNPEKISFFNIEERVRLVREVGAGVMLRGLRTTSDMEYEFTMSLMNLKLDPGIETVFLMAKAEYSHLSSSLLRQIASFRGPLDEFLPPVVKEALEQRVRELQQGASK